LYKHIHQRPPFNCENNVSPIFDSLSEEYPLELSAAKTQTHGHVFKNKVLVSSRLKDKNQSVGLSLQFSSLSVEAEVAFVEPGRRWAHSPSPSKAPGISYQGTMKTSVRMLNTSGGL